MTRFDSYTAHLDERVTQVTIAYFGAQGGDVRTLASELAGADHHELCRYTDEAGVDTTLLVAYWLDPAAFDTWFPAARAAWMDTPHGHFVEVVRPLVSRLETIYSSDQRLQGLGAIARSPSAPIAEHGYWGAMRDRIPDREGLASDGAPVPHTTGATMRVAPHDGLTLIRSGQDYSATSGAERDFYLREVAPHLTAGMEFLRDDGRSIGCFANRYVRVLDDDGRPTEKTFAMSLWRDLADLETWARTHPTHVRIFNAFTAHMNEFGADARLRLYHEVVVVPAEHQYFEYVNCHPSTGLLRL